MYARQRYIDELLDRHDGDVNTVVVIVRTATGCTVRGAVQMVMGRARARGWVR